MSVKTGWRATAGKAERRMISALTALIVLFVIAIVAILYYAIYDDPHSLWWCAGLLAIGVVMTRWPAFRWLEAETFYQVLTAHGIDMLIFWIIFFEMAVLYFTSTALLGALALLGTKAPVPMKPDGVRVKKKSRWLPLSGSCLA